MGIKKDCAYVLVVNLWLCGERGSLSGYLSCTENRMFNVLHVCD